jgi:hypothetical protein
VLHPRPPCCVGRSDRISPENRALIYPNFLTFSENQTGQVTRRHQPVSRQPWRLIPKLIAEYASQYYIVGNEVWS